MGARVEPLLGERYWDGLLGASGLGMEAGTGAKLSPHRGSTWDTDSETGCSHESLRNRCEVSLLNGGSREDRAVEGRKELPELEKAEAVR